MADAFCIYPRCMKVFHLLLQEAGAAGLSNCFNKCWCCNEIVFDNKNGYLCKSAVETNLSSCMIKMMKLDGEKREMMGKLSSQIVKENFDINKTMRDWIALYCRLVV